MKPAAACLAAAISLTVTSGAAYCADVSRIDILGFSPDAKVFAFEEYGVQDGSGFPYSTIFVIDTVKDAYLPGTPYRVILNDDEADGALPPVSEARARSAKAAQALLETYQIAENPGFLAAFNPVSEIGPPDDEISYYTIQLDRPITGAYTLKLDQVAFSTPERCQGLSDQFGGFKLRFTQQDGKPTDATVYADTRVPESRGCVGGYRLGGVALSDTDTSLHMALVQVRSFGFEGYDLRWIAVPVRTLH
ncbi:DUF2259 domain-containing protein [Rhizobium sp. L1K21]|uniref:DUF2259 domain-containing protein n=1 Tax=Rhizobium sp. L1K21 TaxID=2954933 RepID=UPI002092E4C5|nr:DUF2259 domain-containing protein [Rhizobium sp. L1K21]MCO6185887.1 DUF2259 domain-containing protein [Rhizobium sp. L1K21]